MQRPISVCAAALAVLIPLSAFAAAPQLINYQGVLFDDGGVPLDTTVAMEFGIWTSPTLGGLFWTETHPAVTVVDGTFNVLLGSVEPLHDSVLNDTGRYLSVKVGDDPEMTPRTRLVSVPYAHRVATVDGASGGMITSQVAIGTFHVTSGPGAFVAGDRNAATGDHATVGGGEHNKARGAYATVGGGGAGSAADSNSATGDYSTIAGGYRHLAGGQFASVGGGDDHTATGDWSVIAGGKDNATTAPFGVVCGGENNLASGEYATICGGTLAVAGGDYSFIAGGLDNTADGDYSFAAGRYASVGATHAGALLLADSTAVPFHSAAAKEFAVRCTGGARIVTAVDGLGNPTSGACLTPGSGSWASCSDRNAKSNIRTADGADILDRIATLPISTWNYTAESVSVRHIGPMAQDFHAAFGVGADNRHITAIDADGVALAAIQELNQRLVQKDRVLTEMNSELLELRELVEQLLNDSHPK
jgi:hypothetical protein